MTQFKKTVVVGIVVKDDQALLIRRVDKEPGLDWCFPGGSVEQGETEQQAVVREIFEETNAIIVPIKKLGQKPHPLRPEIALAYWHCEYVDGQTRVIEPDKHEAVEWKTLSEIPSLVERDLEFFAAEFIAA